jgi:iron complex outermembrane receptor protein
MPQHEKTPPLPRAAALAAAVAAALAAAAPARADDGQLENITVTAQGRTQAERDVPIAMQVITPQQIDDLGAVNLSSLNGYIPGLQVDGSQPTQPNFTLRGIGTGDFGIGTDAAVGVYMDGVYTGKTGGSLLAFNDVQSTEVLKGPQGTVFGRNSAAGAISVHSNEPSQALDADASLLYGRYDTIHFKGMVNVPLTDTTAVRLAVASNNSNGWLVDQATGERFGGEGEWGTRASFKWAPDGSTKLVASWEHENLDQPARAVYSLIAVPPTATTPPPFPPSPSTSSFINPLDSPLQNDAPNRETRTLDGLTLRYETTLGGLDFSTLTAYRHFRSYNAEDNDGTANALTYLSTVNEEGNSSWQQEFKVKSKNALADWIAGASFYHVDASQVSLVNSTSGSINTITQNLEGALLSGLGLVQAVDAGLGLSPTSGFGFGYPWQEQMVNSDRTNSYSVYGDAIWHLGEATNLTTGLRWTRDNKDVSWYVPPYSAPGLDALYQAATAGLVPGGLTFGQLVGQATGTPLTNVAFANAALTAASPVSASRSWGDLSPRLVLDHKYDANTMVYASVARGFQSGGYDVFSPLASFEPEHMTNFETGIKAAVPSLRLGYEASLFHYRFTNLQNIALVSQQGNLPVYDVTTSDQHATGVDLSGHIEPVRGLSFFGNAEYMKQNYGTYSVQDGAVLDNLDGKPVGTPLLFMSLGGRYAWELAGGTASFLLQGAHQTATRCNAHLVYSFECLDTGTLQTGTAQTRVDLRLGWKSPEDRFGVALLVNNVFNKQYVLVPDGGGEAAYTLGTPYGSISTAPRTYAVEISASL